MVVIDKKDTKIDQLKKNIKWIVIGLILLFATQIISGFLFKSLGIQGNTGSIEKTKAMLSDPNMLFIPLLIAPFIEEFIFRYLLYRRNMKSPYNHATAIISSILFGVAHGQGMILTIPLILNGLIYCFIYNKSNNIFVSVLTHMLFNTIIFSLLYITIR